MYETFKGVGVALVTPFHEDGSIDFDSLTKVVNFVIDGGVNFLVALGTTGETPTMSAEEKLQVLHHIIKVNEKRLPIVAGIGGNNTQEIIDSYAKYPMTEIDGVLSVVPYYNKPTQRGMLAHFKAVCAATTLPVILYNVPGRTGCNLNAETILQIIAVCLNAVAIKEASGNLPQNMAIVNSTPKSFTVLSGDDDLVLAQVAVGLQGVISVAANCFTSDFCKMVNFALENKYNDAQQLHYKMLDGINLLFTEGNPAGVKYVLSKMGLCKNILRLPVVPVSEETAAKIDDYLKSNYPS
jgi:4-hydroxy-tetrahydrodipicolinate synthase